MAQDDRPFSLVVSNPSTLPEREGPEACRCIVCATATKALADRAVVDIQAVGGTDAAHMLEAFCVAIALHLGQMAERLGRSDLLGWDLNWTTVPSTADAKGPRVAGLTLRDECGRVLFMVVVSGDKAADIQMAKHNATRSVRALVG